MTEKPYLAAIFTMLDRENQTEKKAMAYPITRIELMCAPSDSNPHGRPWRVFIVDGDHWQEQQ